MKTKLFIFAAVFFTGVLFPGVIFADQDFSQSGTYEWQVPHNVNRVQVKVWGAGGAGGTGKKIDNSHRAGQGGGAGGYVEQTIDVVPGTKYTVIVGKGGRGVAGKTNASGGGASEFYIAGNRSGVVGASGGGGGVTYVWAENYAGENGQPAEFGGQGGTSDLPAKGGRGYIGTTPSGEQGGGGAVIQGDDRGNPSATSGGGSPRGGQGGSRGRLGPDGSGHCNNPSSGGFLGLPWWATPVPILIIDGLTSDGDCHNDPNFRARHGTFPGGGGGGSDTGLGADGADGKVSIVYVSSNGTTTVPVPPSNPGNGGSTGGGTPVTPPAPEPIRRSSSGGYNQATVSIINQTKTTQVAVPNTLASQTITLTDVPYTGPADDIRKTLLFIGLFLLVSLGIPFLILFRAKKVS